MNLIQELEKEQVAKLSAGKDIPDFAPGDTVLVNVKVVEGERTRIQAYEGVCIARSGAGLNESFTVRKISYGEGVERVFPLYSPLIDSIKLVRRGKVRRAKLYYLRGRRGKAARIGEKQDHRGAEESAEEPRKAIGGLRDAEIAIIRVSAQPAVEILLPMMADDEALQWPGGPPSHLHAAARLASHRSFRRGPRRCSSR